MSEWTEKPLGTLCSIKTGKKDVNEGSPNGAYPFFTCSREVHASDSYSFDTDAILIAGNGAVGDTKLYRGKFEAYQRTYVLDGFAEDLDFIFYVLKGSLSEALSKVVSGSTMPYIRKGDLERFPIPLPPLPEQKKIAHILSTVQRAIEAQERIIQTTTELKKTLMHKLFTEGLRNEPQKQTEIGLVPESWGVVKLGKYIQIAHGYAFKGEFFVSDGPTVLTPGNFKLDGGLYWGKRTKYTTESYEPNVVLNPGELVVVMTDLTPTAKLLGGPAFIPEGRTILHNQRIGRVALKSAKTTLHFLYWVFLSEPFKRYMRQTATGSTVRHTSPSKIYQYTFGLPSLDEQAQAIDCLAKADAKLANAEDKKRALQDLFRTLLHELMTAKTRVHELELYA